MPPQELDKNNGLAVWQPLIYEANKGVSLMYAYAVFGQRREG